MKSISYLGLVCTILFSVSCGDNYLDREPSGYVTPEQEEEMSNSGKEKVLAAKIDGIYALTTRFGSGGTEDHDDFGQKSVDLTLDLMSGDMAMLSFNYGWFAQTYKLADMGSTDTRSYKLWRFYYKIIAACNEIFDEYFDGDEIIPGNETTKHYYGQTKALRAYAYFYLVNLFQHPYEEAKDLPAIPLYRTSSRQALARSTTGEVYEQIITDLQDAVNALPVQEKRTKGNKTTITREVAKALLIQVYLFTGNYLEAAELTQQILDSGYFTVTKQSEMLENGFNSVKTSSWMWGIERDVYNTSGLAGFWSHMDIYTYGYAAAGAVKVMDENLFHSIPDTDIRKSQFDSASEYPQVLYAPYKKFFDSQRQLMGDRQWVNDDVYMRIEEILLLKAEAFTRLGIMYEMGAIQALRELLRERDSAYQNKLNRPTTEELLDEILFNWQVECWGEGKSLFAKKRLKKTITRGPNHTFLAGEENAYSYNDSRMIFRIPEQEINNNPLLRD